jgi:hypothetical protein
MNHASVGLFASVAVILMTGCMSGSATPAPTSQTNLQLSTTDSGKQVTVSVGQEADVLLHTIGPGQYGDPIISSDAMRFLDVTFPGPYTPGGPNQLFRFTAVSPGTTEIHIAHTVQAAVFDLVIVVDE